MVALLAEGVDRNFAGGQNYAAPGASPSSRRAWIEMYWVRKKETDLQVALLAEGVDRNVLGYKGYIQLARRPPHGGRG